jgi:hypothetical protein
MSTCPACHHLKEERLGIAHHDGRMPYAEALAVASKERCPEHRPREAQEQFTLMRRAVFADLTHLPPR